MRTGYLLAILWFSAAGGRTYAQTDDSATKHQNTVKMKEFILLVRVPTTYSSELAKEVNPKWEVVLGKWKADGTFVTSYVFPGESYVLSGADVSIKQESVISDNRRIVSSIILSAASLEKAVELARSCPVLQYGGSIEVREIPPRR